RNMVPGGIDANSAGGKLDPRDSRLLSMILQPEDLLLGPATGHQRSRKQSTQRQQQTTTQRQQPQQQQQHQQQQQQRQQQHQQQHQQQQPWGSAASKPFAATFSGKFVETKSRNKGGVVPSLKTCWPGLGEALEEMGRTLALPQLASSTGASWNKVASSTGASWK
ncbi:unnamed protein product, partial [Polarella glacialis]